MSNRLIGSASAAAAVWLLDRLSKSAALVHLPADSSIVLVDPLIWLTLHRNTGAAFGMASGQPAFMTAFASLLTAALAVWWARSARSEGWTLRAYAIGLILGGSAGNLFDRYTYGAVIDFIDLRVWPIFNVADIAITCGAAVWVSTVLCRGRRSEAR